MKIIDIDTKEVIENWTEVPGNNMFTTKKYWTWYKKEMKKYGKLQQEKLHKLMFDKK
jgi:hypothetical protein